MVTVHEGTYRERVTPPRGGVSDAKRINSAGLSHLVMLVTNAHTNSSRVVLAACSPFIAIVLNRSKLDQFFEVAETVEEAIERLSGP